MALAPIAAALIARPPPTAAPPPPPKRPESDCGSGMRASDFSEPRWARWLRAKPAHSSHSRRWARSAPRSLRSRRPSSWLRDGELGLVAGDPFLELLAERAPGAEDQGLDGAHGELEDLGDLLVAAPLELAHDEGGSLVEGEVAERAADVLGGEGVVLDDCGFGELLLEDDLVRPALRLAEALPADVVRDRDQPVLRRARALASLEGLVGVEEGGLRDVLGVGLVAQDDECVAIDVARVLAIEALKGAVRAEALRENGRHIHKDAAICGDLAPRRRVI